MDLALSESVRVMNVTAGTNGLSPCLLVFGETPRIPLQGKYLPERRQRMTALSIARSEMAKVIARQRLSTAIRHNVPKAADQEVTVCSDVLLYKERPRNEWIGPYKVVAGDGKISC